MTERLTGQESQRDAASPVPYPLSAFERRAARPQAAKGSGAFVLPWRSSPRHELGHALDPSPSHTATNGALALLEAVEEPQTYPASPPHGARRSILLAEDDPRLARVVQSALELEGELDGEARWSVTVASDGARALELAAASPPQVALLDIFLPSVDGVEVYQRLRADPATREARVIFVTAATSLDLYERGIRDGVLLRKPFDLRDLVSLVRALLAE
jgi:CheY-like chemotaxis protein